MNKKTKWFIFLIITAILVIFIFKLDRNNSVQIPTSKDLGSVIFIDIVDNQGVKSNTIYEESDINRLLSILKDSKKTDKKSTSNTPNKKEFTIIVFELLEGGKIFNSIYKDNHDMYFEQPYYGVFELESSTFHMLDKIKKKGNEESILIPINDIYKENLK